MTRETRIGLLVGMGFIIMFGLVLANFLPDNNKITAPVTPQTGSSLAYTPTIEEATPPKPAEAPASTPSGTPVAMAGAPRATPAPVSPSPVVDVDPDNVVVQMPPTSGGRVAAVRPASDVIPGGREFETQPPPVAIPAFPTPGRPSGAEVATGPTPPVVPVTDLTPPLQKYKIVAGDTLSKVALKFYGPGHSADYKLILIANPALRDATALKINQEIVIPPAKPAPAAPPTGVAGTRVRTVSSPDDLRRELAATDTSSSSGVPRLVLPTPPHTPLDTTVVQADGQATTGAGRPAEAAKKSYTIKTGDTLSKIASKMMNDNSPATIQKIMDLNKSKISSPTKLTVGVKLEIPS